MTKREFLDGLIKALSSTGSQRIIRENYNFYQEYIETEIQKGKSEAQVMEELGDPRLIANSIKEAAGIEDEFPASVQSDYAQSQDFDASGTSKSRQTQSSYTKAYTYESGDGYQSHVDQFEDIMDEEAYQRELLKSTRKAKLIIYGVLGGLVLVLILLLVLATAIFQLLAPVLVPLIFILLVVQLFRRN